MTCNSHTDMMVLVCCVYSANLGYQITNIQKPICVINAEELAKGTLSLLHQIT